MGYDYFQSGMMFQDYFEKNTNFMSMNSDERKLYCSQLEKKFDEISEGKVNSKLILQKNKREMTTQRF